MVNEVRDRERGVRLLRRVLAALEQNGYTRYRVDTLRAPDGQGTVRHHYTAGVWELTVNTPTGPIQVRWDYRQTLPRTEVVVQQVLSAVGAR